MRPHPSIHPRDRAVGPVVERLTAQEGAKLIFGCDAVAVRDLVPLAVMEAQCEGTRGRKFGEDVAHDATDVARTRRSGD